MTDYKHSVKPTDIEHNARQFLGLNFAADAATNEARESGLPNRHKGPADAYLHILISAEMARRKGEATAKASGAAHEANNPPNGDSEANAEADTAMDDHNNAIGREIGLKAETWEDVVRMAREKIEESRAASGNGEDGNAKWLTDETEGNWPQGWQDREPVANENGGAEHKYRDDDPDGANLGETGTSTDDLGETPSGAGDSASEPGDEGDGDGDATSGSESDGSGSGETVSDNIGGGHGGKPLPAESKEDLKAKSALTKLKTLEAKSFMAEVTKPDDPVDDILLKPVSTWTQGEADDVMQARMRLNVRDSRRDELFEAEKSFFEHVYGTEQAKYDATGRMIQPEPRVPLPQKRKPAQGADGRTINQGLERVARWLVANSDGRRFTAVVKSLQLGLNLLAQRRAEEASQGMATPIRQPLKTDGVFGAKTRDVVRRVLARRGAARVDEGLALGRFQDFARCARQSNDSGGLARETFEAIGSLLPQSRAANGGRREEAAVLQETLNDLGREKDPSSYWPLKHDGIIGRRTRSAFERANALAGPDKLTQRYGQNLGWLD